MDFTNERAIKMLSESAECWQMENNGAREFLKAIGINQYDSNGELLDVWNNLEDASNSTGISQDSILLCITGITPSAGGYIWKIDEDSVDCLYDYDFDRLWENAKSNLIIAIDKKTHQEYVFASLGEAVSETGLNESKILSTMTIPQDNSDWIFITLAEAERLNDGLDEKQNLMRVMAHRLKTEKDMTNNSCYDNITLRVEQYRLDGHYIRTWATADEAATKNNINREDVIRCVLGLSLIAGEYIWVFNDIEKRVLESMTVEYKVEKMKQHVIKAYDLRNHELHLFASIQQAAAASNVDAHDIISHRRFDGFLNGWVFFVP